MSTNFYWKELPTELKKLETQENHDILMHIGKRCLAGKYCWDCGITGNRFGTTFVHDSERDSWYVKCPICGKEMDKYTCSFTWTFMLQKKIIENMSGNEKCIVDEYGEEYTAEEFFMGANYPIQFQDASDFC